MDGAPYGNARVSPARRDVATAIREMPGAFTVEGLALALVERDTPVALATVYRAVAAMEKAGTLARVGEQDGTALFAECCASRHHGPGDHHHHLVCTRCGSVEPVSCPLGESLISAAGEIGFVITHHEIRLYGMCRPCLRSADMEQG